MREEGLFPMELTADVPRITMTGRQLIHIEQHKGLMAYQEDEIALQTAVGLLKLYGREMRFKLYTATEAMITGEIDSFSLQGGSGR